MVILDYKKTDKMQKILIVDDETDILEFVGYNLRREGYEVHTATNGAIAIIIANDIVPDLILLDVMMPVMNGIETCLSLRKNDRLSETIIAFLTAKSDDISQIEGFEAGADDYIAKPIRPRLLISRVQALLRRRAILPSSDNAAEEVIRLGDLLILKERVQVLRVNDKDETIDTITLARKEFELLYLLASRPGKVFRREEIFSVIWGNDVIVGERTIDVHIRKIREKLGGDYLKTVKGVGYKAD